MLCKIAYLLHRKFFLLMFRCLLSNAQYLNEQTCRQIGASQRATGCPLRMSAQLLLAYATKRIASLINLKGYYNHREMSIEK